MESDVASGSARRTATRDRIVLAAAELLAAGGREAVSTRAVAAAAGVQAPTIYRQFGDMRGLLDAMASHGFSTYLLEKTTRERAADPVDDLRRGWDLHVDFGLANPALYTLMYGDPRAGTEPPAAREARSVLLALVQRAAEAGRLRVGVMQAADMIHAASSGTVLSLIASAPANRDLSRSELTREAILAAITTGPPDTLGDVVSASTRLVHLAVALGAVLSDQRTDLTDAERELLLEWLDRLARTPL